MWMLPKSKSRISSRTQINIKEVRDGILLLPNNEYRAVIETSSVNFELKSEAEQDALIDNFQNFLNSLPSKLQVLVRVREMDIDRYIETMQRQKEIEKDKGYKSQIDNYCEFIKKLVSGNKILSRRFYIILPFKETEKQKDFSLIKEQLHLNQDIVIKGLEKLGMKAKVLDSLEVLELFYSFYNPSQAKIQPLSTEAIEEVSQPYVI